MEASLRKLIWESLKAEVEKAPISVGEEAEAVSAKLVLWRPDRLQDAEESLFQKVLESSQKIMPTEVYTRANASEVKDFEKIWSISFGPRPFAGIASGLASGWPWQDFEFDGCHFRHYQAPELSKLQSLPEEKKKLWSALKTASNQIGNYS